jgi:hypothetical protein
MSTYLVSARVEMSIDADSENEAANLVHDWIHGREPIGARCIECVEVNYVAETTSDAPEWTL